MTLNGAIMQLVEMRENSMMPVVFKPYFDKVIETISECVEPSEIPHWIPVTERLPKERSVVLVTDWRGNVYTDRFIEEIDTKPIWRDIFSDGVLAWMSLPEPYQKEDTE